MIVYRALIHPNSRPTITINSTSQIFAFFSIPLHRYSHYFRVATVLSRSFNTSTLVPCTENGGIVRKKLGLLTLNVVDKGIIASSHSLKSNFPCPAIFSIQQSPAIGPSLFRFSYPTFHIGFLTKALPQSICHASVKRDGEYSSEDTDRITATTSIFIMPIPIL